MMTLGHQELAEGGNVFLASSAHGRRNQDNSISSHKQHRDVSLGGFVHLLIGLLINLNDGDSLLHLSQDHVQMLVIGMQPALQLPLVSHLHIYPLVQGQPDEIQGFLNCPHRWSLNLISHCSRVFEKGSLKKCIQAV